MSQSKVREVALTLAEQAKVEWVNNPQTQELLVWLRQVVKDTQAAWANEVYVGGSIEQGALMNAKALGGIEQINDTLEYITGERHDFGKHERD